MGIVLSKRAFPWVRVSTEVILMLLGISTLLGTHRHTLLSHHLTRRTGSSRPSGTSSGVTVRSKCLLCVWSYRSHQSRATC